MCWDYLVLKLVKPLASLQSWAPWDMQGRTEDWVPWRMSIISVSTADSDVLEEREVRRLQSHCDKIHDLNATVDKLKDFINSVNSVLESLYIGIKETHLYTGESCYNFIFQNGHWFCRERAGSVWKDLGTDHRLRSCLCFYKHFESGWSTQRQKDEEE